MKKISALLSGVLILMGLESCSKTITPLDTTTVNELDINRYMGMWYEIARFDHCFERNLTGCTAYYELQDDENVKVTNSGFKGHLGGKFKQSEGKVRRLDDSRPGQLEVSFFWMFYTQYNVLELAPDYRYALVGGKNDKYLWILSRTPVMDKTDIDYLLEKAVCRGYDISKLIWVEH